MNKTLTVGVMKTGEENYRAILWDGMIMGNTDDIVFTVAFGHSNFFWTIRNLKKTALEWAARSSKHIAGIHDNTACWPINPKVEPEEAAKETERLVSPMKMLGFCAVRLPNESLVAHLFTSGPYFPFKNGGVKAGFPMTTGGKNLFLVTEKLLQTSIEGLLSQKLASVAGIHDEAACWPDSL